MRPLTFMAHLQYIVDDFVKQCDLDDPIHRWLIIKLSSLRDSAWFSSKHYKDEPIIVLSGVHQFLPEPFNAVYASALRRLEGRIRRDWVRKRAQDLILVLCSTGKGIPTNRNQAALCGLRRNSDGDSVLKRETRDLVIELLVAEFR